MEEGIGRGNSTSHFRIIRDSVRIYGELLKFVLSSLSSFCLDYLLFSAMIFATDKNPNMILAANISARLVSGTYNYLVNTKIVFHKKPSADIAVKYAALAGTVLIFNNIFLILSFLVQRMCIFTKKMSR